MACFLTADGGTESLRARVYDADGTCLGTSAVPTPEPGRLRSMG